MRLSPAALALIATLSLSACAGGAQQMRGPPAKVINQVLSTAPGAAQPSAIVKVEIAYARAAKEKGQFTAGLDFATPEAVLHGRNGPVPFLPFAQSVPDPETATQWSPRTVVMSCDGAIALSKGRFVDPEGFVGNYVTVWVRQEDNSYKWAYDVAGRDDPQPPREELEDGLIVVTAIDTVFGLVATCPPRGQPVPPPPAMAIGPDGRSGVQLSGDGTLRWHWEHRADGTKFVKAEYFYEGAWEAAIEESLASPAEE